MSVNCCFFLWILYVFFLCSLFFCLLVWFLGFGFWFLVCLFACLLVLTDECLHARAFTHWKQLQECEVASQIKRSISFTQYGVNCGKYTCSFCCNKKICIRTRHIDSLLADNMLLCLLFFSLTSCMLHFFFFILSENCFEIFSLKLKEYTSCELFGINLRRNLFLFTAYC